MSDDSSFDWGLSTSFPPTDITNSFDTTGWLQDLGLPTSTSFTDPTTGISTSPVGSSSGGFNFLNWLTGASNTVQQSSNALTAAQLTLLKNNALLAQQHAINGAPILTAPTILGGSTSGLAMPLIIGAGILGIALIFKGGDKAK